jgi:hypothetical protein
MSVTVQGVKGGSNTTKKVIPLSRVPEAVYKCLRHPGKVGISKLSWVTSLIPFIGVPALIAGLSARTITDGNQKEFKKPNPLLEKLRNIYPAAYSLMMICGFLNGVAYASVSRMLSYFLLFLGSIYVWQNENKRNEAWGKILNLQNKPGYVEDGPEEEKLRKEAAEATAAISTFSRIYYGFAMFFTFFANLTQTSKFQKPGGEHYFKCDVPDFNKILEGKGGKETEYFRILKENLIKEVSAGAYYSKQLASPAKWKESLDVLTGNHPFEEKLKDYKNPFVKVLNRLGESEFNCRLTMMNGLLRMISVAGTGLAAANLGGINVFNNDDPYLADYDLLDLADERPAMKTLFDSMMLLNNIGLFFMGLCSISTGYNKNYAFTSGPISAILQTIGGSLVIASAACDQIGLYLPGQALKLLSNGALQLANIFGTANKSVDRLAELGLMRGLTSV